MDNRNVNIMFIDEPDLGPAHRIQLPAPAREVLEELLEELRTDPVKRAAFARSIDDEIGRRREVLEELRTDPVKHAAFARSIDDEIGRRLKMAQPSTQTQPNREERALRAVRDIRELIRSWGDGDRARLIRAILDEHNV